MTKYSIELTTEAEQELSESFFWYLSKGENVANGFANAVVDTIESLYHLPFRFRVRFDDFRAAPVHGYPDLIFYRIVAQSVQIGRILAYKTERQRLI